MAELDDFELEKSPEQSAYTPSASAYTQGRSEQRGPLVWVIVAAVVVAAAVGGYLWYMRSPEVPASVSVTEAPTPPPAEQEASTAVEPFPVDVPPLDQSDAVVRQLVSMLSSHPRVAAWLATDGLIRNFVVAVENIASGANPSRHLRALRPTGGLAVIEHEEGIALDPRSYQRYNGIADAVASIDATGAARLYVTLDPRLEEAYGELGHQDGFSTAMQRAIDSLLQVPIVEGEVPLVFRGGVNAYADPRLERLTPAQKQLLRMGPRNVRIIQGKLREIASALGIPTTAAG